MQLQYDCPGPVYVHTDPLPQPPLLIAHEFTTTHTVGLFVVYAYPALHEQRAVPGDGLLHVALEPQPPFAIMHTFDTEQTLVELA